MQKAFQDQTEKRGKEQREIKRKVMFNARRAPVPRARTKRMSWESSSTKVSTYKYTRIYSITFCTGPTPVQHLKLTWTKRIISNSKTSMTFKTPVASPSRCLNPRTLTRTTFPSLKLFSSFFTSLSATSDTCKTCQFFTETESWVQRHKY